MNWTCESKKAELRWSKHEFYLFLCVLDGVNLRSRFSLQFNDEKNTHKNFPSSLVFLVMFIHCIRIVYLVKSSSTVRFVSSNTCYITGVFFYYTRLTVVSIHSEFDINECYN